jgi:glycosyltransferase involved in cell wall biosynthesis
MKNLRDSIAKVVIAGEVHLSASNLPRHSRHTFINSKPFPTGKFPLEKVWYPFGSLNSWQLWKSYDVVHSFGSIQYTSKPWFVTFEDDRFLYRSPELFGSPKNKLDTYAYEYLNHRLALENCKKLIAMSDYARMRLVKRLADTPLLSKVVNKIEVIYPNFKLKVNQPKKYSNEQELQLIFIGNHLARKGGIVALRLASKAYQLGLPVKIHIVSGLRYGLGIPTDFHEQAKYNEDLKLLDLDNVVFHGSIPNQKVLELLSQCHFQLLATLHDTYGFSVTEGFTVATPAITTNVCALPEFMHDGETGYLLNLKLDQLRHWEHRLYGEESKTSKYWEILNSTYEELAEQMLQAVLQFLDRSDNQEHYEYLSSGALNQAATFNNSEKQNIYFDQLYAEAAGI